MRSAQDNGLLKNDNGLLIGINLGADFCSEHEWGIKELRKAFGMNDKGYGLDKRIARDIPMVNNWRTGKKETAVHLIEQKDQTILLVGIPMPEKLELRHYYLERAEYQSDKLITAWDEKSFGLNAKSKEDQLAVKAIYNAIQSGDLAIWVGGGGVFQNGGLVLTIASRIPADKVQLLKDADIDRESLEKAAEKTGIAKKLEKSGKRWFALSPRWSKGFDVKTKHSVVFWLNPCEQQIHNFGWFTVEDLELWADSKGPCMTKNSDRR